MTTLPAPVVRWLVWAPAVGVILSATAITGGIALFLGPLLGVLYGLFCVVAWQGPAAEEVR
jgi:hypothetical protein